MRSAECGRWWELSSQKGIIHNIFPIFDLHLFWCPSCAFLRLKLSLRSSALRTPNSALLFFGLQLFQPRLRRFFQFLRLFRQRLGLDVKRQLLCGFRADALVSIPQ